MLLQDCFIPLSFLPPFSQTLGKKSNGEDLSAYRKQPHATVKKIRSKFYTSFLFTTFLHINNWFKNFIILIYSNMERNNIASVTQTHILFLNKLQGLSPTGCCDMGKLLDLLCLRFIICKMKILCPSGGAVRKLKWHNSCYVHRIMPDSEEK